VRKLLAMQTLPESNCVAVFTRHEDAEIAIKKLKQGGFDVKNVSIVGRDYHTEEHPVGFFTTGDRVKYWGKQGAFWGSVFGIIFAPAFFFIPGIGPILTGGIIGSILMGTVEGAAVGAAVGAGSGAFTAALTSMGIPKDGVIKYEASLKAGSFLLIAHGTPDEAQRARNLLAEIGASEVQVHAR
jgi:uncharacterized membrane protein